MTPLYAPSGDHAALMDSVYRGQRFIYDATRKYYLFGRDTLIAGLDAPPGAAVLELGCGTGRNLAMIARRWPGAALFGLDLSAEMLKSAAAKLGGKAALARGDATAFCADALFGRPHFERIVLSYTLSMIPDWRQAITAAIGALAPGGSLHMVDFGDLDGLPAPLRAGLRAWLARFHVTPRLDLNDCAVALAAHHGLTLVSERGRFGYYRHMVLARR